MGLQRAVVVTSWMIGLLLPGAAGAGVCFDNQWLDDLGGVVELGCNESYSDILSASDPSIIGSYGGTCNKPSGGLGMPDAIFALYCPLTGPVVVELSGLECDFDLYIVGDDPLLDSCSSSIYCDYDQEAWYSVNDVTTLTVDCTIGETYWVVAEGWEITKYNLLYDRCPRPNSIRESTYTISFLCDEVCDDGIDNDTDGKVDCEDLDCPACPEVCDDGDDNDRDGSVDCDDPDCAGHNYCCDRDGDLFYADTAYCFFGGDCNDLPIAGLDINPAAYDIPADGLDQNCDDADACYVDQDGDGYGGDGVMTGNNLFCGDVSPEADDSDDCNDNPGFAHISPSGVEVPGDGIDQNCDDKDDCFEDLDGDGYGSVVVVTGFDMTCDAAGMSAVGGDCDDTVGEGFLIHPFADDLPADNIDQNCDDVDDCYYDGDLDTFGGLFEIAGDDMVCGNAAGESPNNLDCNDSAVGGALFNPNATDHPGDGIDHNCDDVDACFEDLDADGFGSDEVIAAGSNLFCSGPFESDESGDCDDDPLLGDLINPDADEWPADGVDQDCDDKDLCYDDRDLDTYGSAFTVLSDDMQCGNVSGESATSDDCDDDPVTGPDVHPNATEVPSDGVDQNCDEVDACWEDLDEDGFGSTEIVAVGADMVCSGALETATSGDCDDDPVTGPGVNPDGIEVASDGIDQDCDDADDCFEDLDGDTYGSALTVVGDDMTCGNVSGESATSDDCDDDPVTGPDVHPNALETMADGVDSNCDDEDWCYEDLDGDGYGTANLIASADLWCGGAFESAVAGDCLDVGPDAKTVHPNAIDQPADGIDQDCDDVDRCYEDLDGDGVGTTAVIVGATLDCAAAGESSDADDCLDVGADAHLFFPGADEICDNRDNDCDNDIDDDDDDVVGAPPWYADADHDDHGDPDVIVAQCLAPTDYVYTNLDCDPNNGSVHPDADEICDLIDNNCDDEIDEDDPELVTTDTVFFDFDEDGFGDPAVSETHVGCVPPNGWVANDDDCADDDEDRYPGAPEVPYDGVDQDCDNADLDDLDGDTWASSLVGGQDCHDGDPTIHPAGVEVPNGMDDDCNGVVDDTTVWYDNDGDGITEAGGDCAPDDPTIHPFVEESCDGVDEDCDEVADNGTLCVDDDGDGESEDEGDCNDGDATVSTGAQEVLYNGIDDDCDGQIDDPGALDTDGDGYAAAGGDCWPDDPDSFPGAPELADGVDNDCDGTVDEGTAAYDDDDDGFSEDEGDCNDARDGVHPDAEEIINGIDDDCDGTIDAGTIWSDDDGDGYSEANGDCDDDEATVSPGQPEVANERDDDCDGVIDDAVADQDRDGFTSAAGDCDDDNGWVNPEMDEMCDFMDNDCDGEIDEGCAAFGVVDEEPAAQPTGCGASVVGDRQNGAGWWMMALPVLALFRRRVSVG